MTGYNNNGVDGRGYPCDIEDIQFQSGDVFATANPMFLGKLINFVQRNTNRDGKSKYSHVGIITSSAGTTFEALWTYKEQQINHTYKGNDIVIFRHKEMTPEKFKDGWNAIKHLKGKWYPGYRLPMFLIPGLARISVFKKPVCSELFKMFLKGAWLLETYIFGVDPDDVVDMCRTQTFYTTTKCYELIYEGKV